MYFKKERRYIFGLKFIRKYELYSPYGYDMLLKENNNIKDEK